MVWHYALRHHGFKSYYQSWKFGNIPGFSSLLCWNVCGKYLQEAKEVGEAYKHMGQAWFKYPAGIRKR